MTVINTKWLGDANAVDFWVARFLSAVARWGSKNPSKELQGLLLLDEADAYLPAVGKPATKEPLLDLLRRGRSAGLGVLLSTQNPGDLDYKARDNIGSWFVGRIAASTAVAKMKPLLTDARTNVAQRLANASVGEFYLLSGGQVTELRASRSVMDTEQLAEDLIERLAAGSADR